MPVTRFRRAVLPAVLLAASLAGLPASADPGTPLGPATPVTVDLERGDSEPRIAVADDGRHAIAFTRFDYDPVLATGSFNVYVRAFAADGTPLGPEQRANEYEPDYQTRPQVAIADDGSFLVAWLDVRDDFTREQVRARRYGPDGQPRGGDFPVSGLPVPDIQSFGLGAARDGRYTVVTETNRYLGSSPVFVAISNFTGRNFNADDSARGLPYRVGGRNGFEIAVGYVFVGGVVVGTGSTGLAVAVDDDGEVAVAWGGATSGGLVRGYTGTGIDLATSRSAVLLRRFDASGRPRGLGTVVDSGTVAYDSFALLEAGEANPRLAYGDNGDLVIAWQRPRGATPGSGAGEIAVRRYGAAGLPLTGIIPVGERGESTLPAVAAASGGSFVVAWQVRAPGAPFGGSVRVQAFDGGGTPLAPPFPATDTAATDQVDPAIDIARASGTLHLVWNQAPGPLTTRRYGGY